MERLIFDRKRHAVILNLNTRVYKMDKILKIAQTFSQACNVDVSGDVDCTVQVTLKPKSRNMRAEEIGYEFFNHVLAEMKISEDI
ncbi:MAG: hypothetical protein Sv326_1195 [Candidatus Fermentimicrarchaeum limneticum]|uniref:Uncharacterized protein n=1 Tax=Fermentimicrarchaeum limneticum TaxID=2795018 RepID=A0A7D5XKC2_FERL1|nr:MAG: hypothetical protein Sv326_1195 [Candidatus Fermentimicrarchaeum limneticum]